MQDWRYSPGEVVGFIEQQQIHRQASLKSFRERQLGRPIEIGPPLDDPEFRMQINFPETYWTTLSFMCARLDQSQTGLSAEALGGLTVAVNALPRPGKSAQLMSHLGSEKVSPNWMIWHVLRQARPPEQGCRFPELKFLLRDEDNRNLHDRCQRALSEAQDALGLRHYASAAVVAVFVLEALVSWWLNQPQVQVAGPGDKRMEAKRHPGLVDLINSCKTSLFAPGEQVDKKDRLEIEHLLGKCLDAASLRNLIHADKAERSSRDIDAAAAHSAMGAVLSLAQRIGTVLA